MAYGTNSFRENAKENYVKEKFLEEIKLNTYVLDKNKPHVRFRLRVWLGGDLLMDFTYSSKEALRTVIETFLEQGIFPLKLEVTKEG